MNNQQIIQLIFFVIVFGFSGITWVLKKLKEQADRRRVEMDQERRRLESLRTGRPVREESAKPAAVFAGSDLARHRAAQLQELRRLQQARQRAASGQGAPARPPTVLSDPRTQKRAQTASPRSAGPTVPGTRNPRAGMPPVVPQSSRRAGPAARAAPEQAEYNVRRARQEEKRARQMEKSSLAERVEEARKAQEREELTTAGAAAALMAKKPGTETEPRSRVPVHGPVPLFAGMSRDDWRRAILAREILGPPVGSRRTTSPGAWPSGPLG